eukprot:CAMPEP_0174895516 /NCGR_PEP_ID=MMETSP0167-20121228/9916_1 /TAXON_ID=38298 /ORGANISM="Rhodella maculata, Strain CCMP736" /LENGTH=436 /DNA_ID=CAMNT_0016134865 /DNA_START=240 /DNA_END=1550 /DNA_ORIENTATION=-
MAASKPDDAPSGLPLTTQSTNQSAPLSTLGSIANITILILGAGSFALPWAFCHSGIVFAFIGVLLLGLFSLCTVLMLVESKRMIEESGTYSEIDEEHNDGLDYSQIAEIALGRRMEYIVKALTLCSCIGACAGYLRFILGVFTDIFGASQHLIILFLSPLLIVLSMIRTWSSLSSFATVGNILFFLAVILVLYDPLHTALSTPHAPHAPFIAANGPGDSPLLIIGPATFLFTVHYCVLSVARESDPVSFKKVVLPVSFGCAAVLNALFGAVCSLAYGLAVKDNVLRNVQGGWLGNGVSMFLAAALLITYLLYIKPAREYLEKLVLYAEPTPMTIRGEILSRLLTAFIVLLTVLISAGVQNFAVLTGTVGCITDAIQAYALPPLIYASLLVKRDRRESGVVKPLTIAKILGSVLLSAIGLGFTAAALRRLMILIFKL